MKTLEQIKKEVAKDTGESDFDFIFETEISIGDYKTAKMLWDNVFYKYVYQFEDKETIHKQIGFGKDHDKIMERVFDCIDYSPDKTRENLCREFDLKIENYF